MQLAAVYHCAHCTIVYVLRALGVPRRKFSPFTSGKVSCPYTAEALRLLYWREARTKEQIADHATEATGQKISRYLVGRWLREFGITERSASEVRALIHRQKPDMNNHMAAAIEARRGPVPFEFHPELAARMRKIQPQGVRAIKKKAQGNFETRPCARCGKPITKKPYLFTHPPERTFCNSSCSNRGRKREKTNDTTRVA